MAAMLRRLQLTWDFSQKIDENDIDFFRYFVKNHQLLSIEYSIHCTTLAHDLLHKDKINDKAEVTRQIEEALKLAELLEHIYRYYLNVPSQVARFRGEQDNYREVLVTQGYQFLSNDPNDNLDPSVSKAIRDITGTVNVPRNFITRLRRLLVTTTLIARDFDGYRRWIGIMDDVTRPIFAYAAWAFFSPRALTNLFLTGKHVIPGSWMSDQEKSLGWSTRFRAQMERRWFELGNDIAWMTLGLLNCFVLTGVLAPIGFYGSAVLLAYDVVLACFRAYLEISRLQKLEADYHEILAEPDLSTVDREQTANYLIYLQQRISYEQKRLYVQVINTSILLLAFSLAFPIFAFNPVIPLIGATIAVLATIACYCAVKWVEKQKPVDKVTPLMMHSFFKPSDGAKKAPPVIEINVDESASKEMLLPSASLGFAL